MGSLRVVLFGGPAVYRDSREIPLSPHQKAALGVVYGHGAEGVSRDRLIWLLWEVDDEGSARHRLSQLLYAAGKRVVAPALFEVRGDEVLPNPSAIQSDLSGLHQFTKDQRYAEAATLVSRGFLGGLNGSVSRELDDWRDARALALRAGLREAAAKGWSDAEANADWSRAREAAEALLILDPDSEPYLRCVMKARALTGAPEEAEAAFRCWIERQSKSTGADDATLALLARTRASASKAYRQRLSSPGAEPPFVGRHVELKCLRAAFRDRLSNSVSVILVTGEPGIGKTKLVREACHLAAIEGLEVIQSSCTALGQQIPLNPIIDALVATGVGPIVRAMAEPWRSVISHILPEAGTPGNRPIPQAEPPVSTRRLFEALQQVLEGLAARRAWFLWIDDAQWADETTLSALEFIVRRWKGGPAVLCLSARGPQADDPTGRRFVERLDVPIVRLPLAELQEHEATLLVKESLGVSADEETIRMITTLGPRNPFYLIELSLEYQQGRREAAAENRAETVLPASIQHILSERLSYTTAHQRRILQALSVSGELPVVDLETLGGFEAESLSADLIALLNLRLLRYSGSGVATAHELLRQVVYGTIDVQQRAFLHHRVAELLRSRAERRLVGQIAIHFDLAGAGDEACRFATTAADISHREGALPEAIRFLRIGRKHARTPDEVAQLLAREGQMLLHCGEELAALGVLSTAEQELRRTGQPSEAILAETLRLGLLSKLAILDHAECARQLERVMRDAEDLGRWDLYLRALEATMRVLEREGDIAALRRTARAADCVPPNCGPEVACMALAVRALDVLFGGGDGAVQAATAAVRIAREAGLEGLIDRTEYRLFVTLLYAGALQTPDAPYSVDQCTALAQRTGDFWLRVNCYNSIACWMIDTGDLHGANECLGRARAVLGDQDEGELLSKILVNEAELALYEGDYEGGMQQGLRALALPYNARLAVDKMIAQGATGLCAFKAGNLSVFWQIAKEFRWSGDSYFECSLPVWFCVELARARGDLDEGIDFLRRTAEGLRGRLHLTWIKLVLLDIEYTWKRDAKVALKKAEEARDLSGRLGLRIRVDQFETWIRRLQRDRRETLVT